MLQIDRLARPKIAASCSGPPLARRISTSSRPAVRASTAGSRAPATVIANISVWQFLTLA
jgi:hypothetical protein